MTAVVVDDTQSTTRMMDFSSGAYEQEQMHEKIRHLEFAHERGNCRAAGIECRCCGRIRHFARVCGTARPSQQ